MPEQMRHLSKNGHSVLDALMEFYVASAGGFAHAANQNGELVVNGMASQQAGYALVAYDRFKKERTHCMICLMQSHYISDPWRQRM